MTDNNRILDAYLDIETTGLSCQYADITVTAYTWSTVATAGWCNWWVEK